MRLFFTSNTDYCSKSQRIYGTDSTNFTRLFTFAMYHADEAVGTQQQQTIYLCQLAS